MSGKNIGDVIIDSGASHHMTGDLSLLVNVKETLPCVVGFADGRTSTSVHMGDMILTNRISLKDVLFVPKLDCSLISVSKLLKHSNCFALFTDTICVLQDRSSKTLIGAGEERGGVYFFRDVRVAEANRAVTSDDLLPWHRRLGHPAFSISSSLSTLSSVLNKASSSPCDVCFRAKQTRDVFSDSINKTSKCFELIHVDVWGPYRVPSSCGAVYFLTVVDDFSRAVWTYLLLAKSEVKRVMQRFCAYAVKQFSKEVEIVRSDNGMEFMCLGEYFRDNGIVHQTSCVATPQQNGRVERKHRHILNVARSLLFQSNLPVKFWGEAISTATHVINMTPSVVLKGKSPYEVLFGKKPSYDTLRVFGSLCYVHRRDRSKDKFGERSRKCVFVGYPFGKKAWRVYDIEKNEFLVSRDVSFIEDVFPFSEMSGDAVHQIELTGGSDGDWTIETIVVDRGSTSQAMDESITPVDNSFEAETTFTKNIQEENVADVEVQKQSTEQSSDESVEGDGSVGVSPAVIVEPEMGRGHREKIPSVKLRDYVNYNARCIKEEPHHAALTAQSESSSVQGKTPYPLQNYISDERFSPAHKTFLAAITSGEEPRSYKEAVQQEIWRNSMKDEIGAFELNKTFIIVDLPPGKKAIGNMWVYKSSTMLMVQ